MDVNGMTVEEAEKYFWRKYMESKHDPEKIEALYYEMMAYPLEAKLRKDVSARIIQAYL